jgi:hypothetical protein
VTVHGLLVRARNILDRARNEKVRARIVRGMTGGARVGSAISPDRSLEDPVSVRMLYGVPKVPFLGSPLLSGFISSVHQRFAVPLYETWNRLHRPIVVASALTDMVVAVNARAQSALTDSVQGVEGRGKVKVLQGAPHSTGDVPAPLQSRGPYDDKHAAR